jgi:hypothetical protein
MGIVDWRTQTRYQNEQASERVPLFASHQHSSSGILPEVRAHQIQAVSKRAFHFHFYQARIYVDRGRKSYSQVWHVEEEGAVSASEQEQQHTGPKSLEP